MNAVLAWAITREKAKIQWTIGAVERELSVGPPLPIRADRRMGPLSQFGSTNANVSEVENPWWNQHAEGQPPVRYFGTAVDSPAWSARRAHRE